MLACQTSSRGIVVDLPEPFGPRYPVTSSRSARASLPLIGSPRDRLTRKSHARARARVNGDHIPDVFAIRTKVGPAVDPFRRKHGVARMTSGTVGVRPVDGRLYHERR